MADDQTFHDDIEAYGSRLSCLPGRHARPSRLDTTRALRRQRRALGRDPRRRVVRDGPSGRVRRAAVRRGLRGMPLAGLDGDPGRRAMAVRLPSRHLARPRCARGPRRGARRLRRARRAARATRRAAGDRHQHVQRVQQLGRPQPLHRRQGGVVPPAVRAGDDRAATEVERDDRKARPTPVRRGARRRRRRSTRSTASANGYPGYMGSSRWFTYERRFVEWAEARRVRARLRRLDRSRRRPGDRRRATRWCSASVTTSTGRQAQRDTVEAHVRGGGNYVSMSGNTMFWQVRLEDDGDTHGLPQVLGPRDRSRRRRRTARRRCRGCGPTRWSAGRRRRSSARGRRSGCTAASARRRRAARGFTVYRDDHWLFAGTGLRYGDLLGADDGVVGYETVGCRWTFDDHQLPVRPAATDRQTTSRSSRSRRRSNLGDG